MSHSKTHTIAFEDIRDANLAGARWHYSSHSLTADFTQYSSQSSNWGAMAHGSDYVKDILMHNGGNSKKVERATLSGRNNFAIYGDKDIGIFVDWAKENNEELFKKLSDRKKTHLPEKFFQPSSVMAGKPQEPDPESLRALVNSGLPEGAAVPSIENTLPPHELPLETSLAQAETNLPQQRWKAVQMRLFPDPKEGKISR